MIASETRVGGKFRLTHKLAAGTFGLIFMGKHLFNLSGMDIETNSQVAVKMV
jgi:hypothetical protein